VIGVTAAASRYHSPNKQFTPLGCNNPRSISGHAGDVFLFVITFFERSIERGSSKLNQTAAFMYRLRRVIAALLDRLARMLLIGTAAIFAAAQRMDPSRIDE
jgi:hypothetical protein